MGLEILTNSLIGICVGQIYKTFGSPFMPNSRIKITNVELCKECPVKTDNLTRCDHNLKPENMQKLGIVPCKVSYEYLDDGEKFTRCIESFYREPATAQLIGEDNDKETVR